MLIYIHFGTYGVDDNHIVYSTRKYSYFRYYLLEKGNPSVWYIIINFSPLINATSIDYMTFGLNL